MGNLILKNISHSYGKNKVLDEINLTAKTGEVTCLLGQSGCGKSTVLKIAAGLEQIQSGSVCIGEGQVTNVPAEKRQVGLVFQNPSLFPHLNVLENTMFGIDNVSQKIKRQIAISQLAKVHMEKFLTSYPSMLSGGQQQRVSIARALSHAPRVMLLDEPFANLDVVLRKKIREESLGVLKSTNIATLMVTHDPEEALQMADNIYVMQHGKIVQNGTPLQLYLKPKNKFIASFFGDLNCIGAKVKNKIAKTLLKDFPAKTIADGTDVEVIIRPENISLCNKKSKNSIEVLVEDIRFLGMTSIVYLTTLKGDIHLRCRILSDSQLSIGNKVCINIDKASVLATDKHEMEKINES